MEAERGASYLKKTQELIELAKSGKILYTDLWKNMVRLMSVASNRSIQEGVTWLNLLETFGIEQFLLEEDWLR